MSSASVFGRGGGRLRELGEEGGLDGVMGVKARAGGCSTNPSEVVQGVSVVAGPLFRCLAGWQLQAGSRAMGRLYKPSLPHYHTRCLRAMLS